MLNKYFRPIFILTLCAILNASALERLSLLPPDSQMHMRISNTAEFFSQLKEAPVGKMWTDPQFQDFAGNPTEQTWIDLLYPEKSEAYKEIMLNQLKMLQGELIVDLNINTNDLYIIATMTDEDYRRSLEQDKKLKELEDNPFETVNDKFQGVKLIRYVYNGGTEEEKSSWQAHLANTLLVGPNREWIERSIIQLKKESPEEPEGSPSINARMQVTGLVQKWIESMDKQSQPAQNASNNKAIFEALGLLEVESITFSFCLEETESVADSTFQISNLDRGLFRLLDTQASTLPTVTFIPETFSAIEVGRVNLLGLWRELPNIITSISPAGKMQFDMIAGMIQQQTQIDIDQDLLSNLDTQYLSFSETDPETKQQVSVMGMKLKDSTSFKTALETALSAPALQPQVAALLEQETFFEHTIYTIKSQQEGAAKEPAAFSVAADYLFYGPPEAIRRVIRTQAGSEVAHNNTFEHSPLVRGLRQHVPNNAFGYSATDLKKQMEHLIKEITNPLAIEAFKKGLKKSDKKWSLPDVSKLPPTDHLASFFNASYQYFEKTDTGLHQRIITKY